MRLHPSSARYLIVGAVVTLTASRASAQIRTPTHVACVGDSITAGYAASSANASYPADLQRLFGTGVQVMNFGRSSATMLSVGDLPYQQQAEYTSATSFVSAAGASAVVDVVIMLGTNDSKPANWMAGTGTRAQQFVVDCGNMVDHFAALASHPVVYLALPPRAFANTYGISGTIIHDQILPLIRQVAAAKGAPLIDLDAVTASRSDLLPDGVHPNDTGYQLVAQTMHDGLLLPLSGGGQGGRDGSGGPGGGVGAGGRRGGGGSTGSGGVGGRSGNGGGGRGGASATGSGGSGGVVGGGSGGIVGGGSGGIVGGGSGGTNATGSGGANATGTGGGSGGANATGSGGRATEGSGGASSGGGSGGANATGSGGRATEGSGGANATGTGGGSGGANATGSGGRATEGSGGAGGRDSSEGPSDQSGCACDLPGHRGDGTGLGGIFLAAVAALARPRRRSDRGPADAIPPAAP